MDLSTTGSPLFLIIIFVFVLVATICLDRNARGAALFFGLLSIILALLFCTAQILKRMP